MQLDFQFLKAVWFLVQQDLLLISKIIIFNHQEKCQSWLFSRKKYIAFFPFEYKVLQKGLREITNIYHEVLFCKLVLGFYTPQFIFCHVLLFLFQTCLRICHVIGVLSDCVHLFRVCFLICLAIYSLLFLFLVVFYQVLHAFCSPSFVIPCSLFPSCTSQINAALTPAMDIDYNFCIVPNKTHAEYTHVCHASNCTFQ